LQFTDFSKFVEVDASKMITMSSYSDMLINPKLSAASQYRRKKGGKKGKSDVLNQKETTDARYKRVVEELE
jgi:hypothetical protein